MSNENLYGRLADFIEAGETVAVATIVDVRGSVPREVGAKMIIHPMGSHVGTVGGGCGEADVIRAALDVIESGRPATVRVDLTEDVSMQALGVCGGIMDVFVEQAAQEAGIAPAPRPDRVGLAEHLSALQSSALRREPVAQVTVVRGADPGRKAVVWLDRPPLGRLGLGEMEGQVIADAQAVLAGRQHKVLRYPPPASVLPAGGRPAEAGEEPGELVVFVEVQRRAPEMIIVGGGHIAIPLAQVASMCDFAVTVLDDRASFVTPSRFPTAQKLIAAPLRETVREMAMDLDTFVVLVTRGHSHDVECLIEMLDRQVAYIGMIGSQRRVSAVFQLLEEEVGFDPARFDRVHAPIGIAIGAQTPAEIAICIMAEVVNVLRGGPAVSISDRRRERDRLRRQQASPSHPPPHSHDPETMRQ